MKVLGFTINTVTLLAIILAIGLVVDDAIVMLENIHRHIEKGLSPKAAAFKGSKEIGFSVVAMTITLAAVYAPTGFMGGMTAELFREFAFTLAGAVIISGFVALTLSPMMCAYILKPAQKESYLSKRLNILFEKFTRFYQKILKVLLNNFWIVIIILVTVGIIGFFTFRATPKDLIPKEDMGFLISTVTYPPSASQEFKNRYTRELNKIYEKVPGIKYFIRYWRDNYLCFEKIGKTDQQHNKY